MSELSAEILLLSVMSSVSLLSSQHRVLLLQKCWSKKTVLFLVYAMDLLAAFANFLYLLGIFLAYFHFDSVCNCVCCFCCATALNSVCLTASGLFFRFFFLVFWIPSHAKVLSFVISLILFDNFFWLVNFSLFYQGLTLIIVAILSLFYNLSDANYHLICIRSLSSLCKLQYWLF